eukprot:scaffold991_cov227-Pinguiococcus_pyrenoidosus.AAC.15
MRMDSQPGGEVACVGLPSRVRRISRVASCWWMISTIMFSSIPHTRGLAGAKRACLAWLLGSVSVNVPDCPLCPLLALQGVLKIC